MKRKIIKKHHLYIIIPLFIFLLTFFLFYNVTETMYYNIMVIIAELKTKSIAQKTVINPEIFKKTVKQAFPLPPVLAAGLFDSHGSQTDSFGPHPHNIKVTPPDGYTGSGPYTSKTENNQTIMVWNETLILSSGNNATLTLWYDIGATEQMLLSDRKRLLLLIFLFNAIIFFFLAMIILSYQRRITIKERDILALEITDRVTGLTTRNFFFKQLQNEIERHKRNQTPFALLIADIDDFREFHTKYAFEFGDMVLRTVATIFKTSFRKFDIIGKVGDDEIAVVMINSGEDDGIQAATRCTRSVSDNKFYFKKEEITFSISFGISATETSIDQKGQPTKSVENWSRIIVFDTLNALSRAKREGGNAIATASGTLKVIK